MQTLPLIIHKAGRGEVCTSAQQMVINSCILFYWAFFFFFFYVPARSASFLLLPFRMVTMLIRSMQCFVFFSPFRRNASRLRVHTLAWHYFQLPTLALDRGGKLRGYCLTQLVFFCFVFFSSDCGSSGRNVSFLKICLSNSTWCRCSLSTTVRFEESATEPFTGSPSQQ